LRHHRNHARDGHASDWPWLAIPVRIAGCEQGVLRRQQDLQMHAAHKYSGREFLVVHGVRQPDTLDARHAAALPARRQPELSVAGRGAERRRVHDHLLRAQAAGRDQARQLDSNHAGQGLVYDPASLRPARTVLRQVLAAERNRDSTVKWSGPANRRVTGGVMKVTTLALEATVRLSEFMGLSHRRSTAAGSPAISNR